jgi:hypothetical protein
MHRIQSTILLVALILFGRSFACSQGETALPFLLITPSIDGNGMGGVGTSLGSDNATATLQNPAQLGLFGLHGFINAAFYTPKTDWLPEFNLTGLTYETWAVNGAVRVNRFVNLPFQLAVGVGYSRVNLDLGRFAVTSSSGPAVISYFDAWERSSAPTIGVGIDCVVKLSAGMTFKSVESHLSPVGTESEPGRGVANVNARDYGIMAVVPVMDVITATSGASLEILPKIRPLFDIGFGYAESNVSDDVVSYVDAAQSDPLPRKAAIGMYIEAGAVSNAFTPDWKPLSFMLVRETEDVLVTRFDDGTWKYQTGLGDIKFIDNLVLGEYSPKVWMRRGWQVQAGEIVYVRGGSIDAPGLKYQTSGYTLRLGGVFKLIMALSPEARETGWLRVMADVLDLQFTSAKYSGTSSPIRDTSFKGVNIVLRSIPFID